MHIEVSAVTDAIPRLAHSERDKLEWIKTASVIVICLLAVAVHSCLTVLSITLVEIEAQFHTAFLERNAPKKAHYRYDRK